MSLKNNILLLAEGREDLGFIEEINKKNLTIIISMLKKSY